MTESRYIPRNLDRGPCMDVWPLIVKKKHKGLKNFLKQVIGRAFQRKFF